MKKVMIGIVLVTALSMALVQADESCSSCTTEETTKVEGQETTTPAEPTQDAPQAESETATEDVK